MSIQHKLVAADTTQEFERKVNTLLDEGWLVVRLETSMSTDWYNGKGRTLAAVLEKHDGPIVLDTTEPHETCAV